MRVPDRIVISCEHGGNTVPPPYRDRFRRAGPVLAGHRGWDPGAASLARRLARRLGVRAHLCRVTRLLVECNRSPPNHRLFSEFVADLRPVEKRRILDRHYLPYRSAVEAEIRGHLTTGSSVLHLSVHSFTPVLDGEVRRADVGLLYDPSHRWERSLIEKWRPLLLREAPELRIRRNYPYLGVADGFAANLRRRLPRSRYAGMELEVNQKHLHPPGPTTARVTAAVETSLLRLLGRRAP